MADAESCYKLKRQTPDTEESANISYENFMNIKAYTKLNFLLVGQKNGQLAIYVFGLFICGQIDIGKYFQSNVGREYHILNAKLTSDLKTLIMVVEEVSDGGSQLRFLVFDTSNLARNAEDIYIISAVRATSMWTSDQIKSSVESIIEAHEHIIVNEWHMRLSEYAKNSKVGTMSAEFMELLLMGIYSAELATFILSELSDKKLKKVDSAIEVSHSNIKKEIVQYLRPNIEMKLFELTTMLGLSRVSNIFPDEKLKLEESTIKEALVCAAAFNIKANQVLHILDDSSMKYKAFIKWLISMTALVACEPETKLNLNQREINLIMDYLRAIDSETPFAEKDELGQHLKNKDVAIGQESTNNNLWRKFLNENPRLEECELIIPRSYEKKSLFQVYVDLTALGDKIFENFCNYIPKNSNIQNERILFSSNIVYKKNISIIESTAKDFILVAMVINDEKNILRIAEISRVSTLKDQIANLYFQTAEGQYAIIDAQFYTNEILSVLLGQRDKMHTFCVQLPVEIVRKFYNCTESQNVFSALDVDCLKTIEMMKSYKFAVSGPRRVSIVVNEDNHRIRIFEMEADDEDENVTVNSSNVSNDESSKMDFTNSPIYETSSSANVGTDESDDKAKLESSLTVLDIDDVPIDLNTTQWPSGFDDIESLIARSDVLSLDTRLLEKDIAGLVLNSQSNN